MSRIEIGGVARAHGIRGEGVVVTHDPDSATLGDVETIYVGGVARKIVQARDTHRGWLLQFDGITTRNEAETLQGLPVEVERDVLALEQGEVLLADLVGCAVQLVGAQPWGTIFAVHAGELQDVLVIHDGDVERMLPMVDLFVKDIDLDARVVTVDPPLELPEWKR